jgi:hypothetical protein
MIGASAVGRSTSITAAQTSTEKSSSAVEKVSGEYSNCQRVSGRLAASSRSTFAPSIAMAFTSSRDIPNTILRHAGLTALYKWTIAVFAPSRLSKLRTIRSRRDCVSTWMATSSGTRPVCTSPLMKSNSVAPALGKPTSISFRPTFTSRSKKRVFFSASIGSINAWLPSRRSVDSQRGAAAIVRDGHRRSGRSMVGKGRYLADGSRNMTRLSRAGAKGESRVSP